MKKYFILIPICCLVFLSSCEDSASQEVQVSLFQAAGCKSNALSKISSIGIDSCFFYTFTQNLEIDFCLSGNCCPDKNRFATNHKIFADTIIITVKDTAPRLCHCICNYIIHGEFQNLARDKYFVKCIREEENLVIYEQSVIRNSN